MSSGGNFDKYGREFAAGTVLFREGDAGEEMYVIQSGKVKITRRVGAHEALLAILPEGEFLGEMSIVSGQPRTATATVVEDAKVLVLDGPVFEAMVSANAEVAIRLIKKLADRLERANAHIEILLHRDPKQRVVHYLRQEASNIGISDEGAVRIPMHVQVLAEQVGLSLEEIDGVLRKLERGKLVRRTDDGEIEIPELKKLQDFLDFLEIKERFSD